VVYRSTGGDAAAVRYDLTWNPGVVDAPLALGSAPSTFAFHAPRPNPSRSGTSFAFDLPAESSVNLDVFDVSGRRVHSLAAPYPAGRHQVAWDGRSDSGARAAAGVYYARLITTSGERTLRVVLLD
jgi:hypothetical protein